MMMKKITALYLVAFAMVVSVRESQAEWSEVLDNGCTVEPSEKWLKFGDWCHSE